MESAVRKENKHLSTEEVSLEDLKLGEYLEENTLDQPLRAACLAKATTAEMTSNSSASVPSFSLQILLNALTVNKA